MTVATQSKGLWSVVCGLGFGMSSNLYRFQQALHGVFKRVPTRFVMLTVQVGPSILEQGASHHPGRPLRTNLLFPPPH